MKSDINNDLSKLNEWAKLWLVDFNPKKSKALDISTNAVPHLDLRFNGEPVEIVKKRLFFLKLKRTPKKYRNITLRKQ
jgi:hypothetical protein